MAPPRESERTLFVAQLPWVTRLPIATRKCQGYKWNMISLKHTHSMGGRPPEGIPDKAKCSLNAWWHFEALVADTAKSQYQEATTGYYCWHHLWQQIYCNLEHERALKFWREAKEKEDGR